jgi:NAD-dependent deacetylase
MSGPAMVVLTGAGISAESGLATFRGRDGMWEDHRVADVATPEGFAADPVRVQRFYNRLRRQLRQAAPNAAHYALARLERAMGQAVHVVTQNIDDLHQRAGSVNLTAMHGELTKIRHVQTGDIVTCRGDVDDHDRQWRPHVVWFGEATIGLREVAEKLSRAAVFIAIGTSGSVYPASKFAEIAAAAGATTVEINTEPSGLAFNHTLIGPATQRVPELVDDLLAGLGTR